MNILSIDIGIKHLAHCILRIQDNLVTILDWDVLDLTNEEIPKCNFCNKNATYKCIEGCYCKVHTRKLPYFIELKDNPLDNLTKKTLEQLIELMDVYQKTKPGLLIELDAQNKTRLLKSMKEFKKTKMFSPIKKLKTKDFDIVTLGKTINEKYTTRFSTFKIDKVLIENQLGTIAPRMKTIQGMVSQYFIMKGVEDIDFVSAGNKLKRFIGKNSKYSERKKKGIEVTLLGLEKDEGIKEWKSHFLTHKKKDDLADAYLQGLWYIENNILNAEYLKL